MNTIQIAIKGQQSHISQFNRVELFSNPDKAKQYLLEWLDMLAFDFSIPSSDITIQDGAFYDCRDYIVTVELA